MADGLPVAVLGSNGFIGQHLCSRLQADGHEVIGWTSRDCDLTDALEVKQKLATLPSGVRLVMCATVNRSVEDSYRAMGRNLLMAENLVDGAPAGRIGGLLFLSTVDVYGRAPRCPITERTAPRPMNYYGIGKLASEHLLRRPGAIDCPVTVLRLPGVYGPGDGQRSIVGAFLQRIARGEEIVLNGDGSVLRDYIEVTDVYRIVAALLDQPSNMLLNVAKGESLSLMQVIETLAAVAGRRAELRLREADDNAAGDLLFDIAALRAAVPDLSFTPLAAGAHRYLQALDGTADGRRKLTLIRS